MKKQYRLLFGTLSGKRGDVLELTAAEAADLGDLIREVKVAGPAETKEDGPEERKPARRTRKAEDADE